MLGFKSRIGLEKIVHGCFLFVETGYNIQLTPLHCMGTCYLSVPEIKLASRALELPLDRVIEIYFALKNFLQDFDIRYLI